MTATMTRPSGAGPLLRTWRQRRRLSQLELAHGAEVSARHLSFVETGRAKPSRELLLHLAEHLDVPLRERNALLLAAGYAPSYDARALDDDEMAPARAALDTILRAHEPFPALIVDRHWNLVSANAPTLRLLTDGVAPWLLEPPVNVVRVSLHPEGLAPRIANLAEWHAHMLHRLTRQLALTADPTLADLLDEVRSYPAPADHATTPASDDPADLLFVPLALRAGPNVLRLFGTIATFGTAVDVTLAELSIEQFFPADRATEDALRALARS